ncbi:CTR copper uptake transporter [Mycena vitilis]|nr:CTR copper uptake transporter [Mycena vitilis]
MDSTTNTTMGMMMTALHFTPLADTLWFAGWVPSSGGALAGACIGLFVLALLDRYVAAMRVLLSARWAAAPCDGDEKLNAARKGKGRGRGRLHAPPFVAKQDVPRGALYALQTLFGFAFMLAVMTFQAAFIISIIVGFGVGEMLFGRYVAGGVGMH